MSISRRTRLYDVVQVNENYELDYLNTSLEELNLTTIQTFRIPQAMEHRPDLVAFRLYGDFNLGWLLSLHNDMLDPIMDFTTGRVIDVPSLDEYFRFYQRNARRRTR